VDEDERCDDGDIDDGDGCSSGCEIEITAICDDSEPSICTLLEYEDLGVYAAGEEIPDYLGGAIADGESAYYLIEFTEDILLSGRVSANAGDPDVTIREEDGTLHQHLSVTETESWTDDELSAGQALIQVEAWAGFSSHTVSLSTMAP
jgi:cysteine-rich repeat protein